MSGLVHEIIGFIVFAAFALFIFVSARKKVTEGQMVGFMIVIAAFFVGFTAFTWKIVGF